MIWAIQQERVAVLVEIHTLRASWFDDNGAVTFSQELDANLKRRWNDAIGYADDP